MNRDEVLTTLRDHESELRQAGVLSLALFGSFARNESGTDSDVDLVADFSEQLSILDIIRIENKISDMVGRKVDLVEKGTFKPRIQRSAERDLVRAF